MKIDKNIPKKRCYICGKKNSHGNSLNYRGLPKKTGGIGLKITSITKRVFKPNLQRVRHEENGQVLKVYVCTKCLKAGKISKPTIKAAA